MMIRGLIVLLACTILVGCLYSRFEVDLDELELMPKEAAATFLNQNQINKWCRWGPDSAEAPDYGTMKYDSMDPAYTVVDSLDGSFRVYVVFSTSRFVGTMCPIADWSHGYQNGYSAGHYSSRDTVVNIVTALESLGIRSLHGQSSAR